MRNAVTIAVAIAATLAVACSSAGVDSLLNGSGAGFGWDDAGAQGSSGNSDGGAADAGSGTPDTGGSGNDAASGGHPPAPDSGSSPPPPPAGAGIPCDVAAVLASKCVSCHSDPPVNNSLAGLVTLADLMATSHEDPTKNEAQLALARMQGMPSPMPPAALNNPATAADIAAFQRWINGNYQGSCAADAGSPPPAAVNVFTGAPAFVSQVAGSTHNAGKNCMGGCHDHGFTFAGTLTDGMGGAVAGAEVRLVDSNGTAITVHTGPEGNFHSSTPFVAPAHVGARNGSSTALMVTALQASNGGCNGCHVTGGAVAPIHLP